MCIWAPFSWSWRILNHKLGGPSGTLVKLRGSHDLTWGTKGRYKGLGALRSWGPEHKYNQSINQSVNQSNWLYTCSRTFFGTSSRAITGLSYGLFKAIRHKFHCQLPSKEPLVIVRKGWFTEIFEWETLLAADKGWQPNTSEASAQDQNELRKGIFILTLAFKRAVWVRWYTLRSRKVQVTSSGVNGPLGFFFLRL
jgi:hypothetical protein